MMWKELIAQKERWIGGSLVDFGDSMDRRIAGDDLPGKTTIVDMALVDRGGGPESYFEVVGEAFTCGGAREVLGVTGRPQFPLERGGLALCGYGGHEWHIVPRP